MKTYHHSKYVLLVLISFLFAGCDDGILYQDSQKVNGEQWVYEDTLSYTFSVKDTTVKYNLLLDIYHERSFPYENLYLNIETSFPNSPATKQQLSFDLMDQNGNWAGTCKGNDCILEVMMKEGFVFAENGVYKIEINQWSREQSLSGITSIGLCIQESEK